MQSPIQFQKQPPMATLMDVYSVTSGNNEVASFGYSNANNVAIRMYDRNTPSLGGIFGYNSNSFYFTRDTGSVNVGINTTSNISSALYITGDAQVLGTLTTSNLVVTGNSAFTNFIATIGTVQSCVIYNPTGIDSTNTPYKNIQTNDSVSSNLILMTFTLDAGRYFYNANIPYKSVDPIVSIGTSDSTIGLYMASVTSFKGVNDTPLQKQLINFTSTSEQMSTNVLFYLDIAAKTDYIIALVGKGNNIKVGGNGFVCSGGMISIAGLGTDNSYTLRRPLQIAPVRQTFVLSSPSSNFAVQTTGLYQITQSSNVEVYRNGIKLAYYSAQSNDYTVSYTNDTANTYFNIKTASFLATQDIVDIKVYPELIVNSAFQSSYLYQTIGKSEEYYANLNVTPNSNTVLFQYNSNIGIGVTMPIQTLDVRGQCIVSSNVGIGTTFPLNKLHIEGNTYITGGIQYNYETITSNNSIVNSNLISIVNPKYSSLSYIQNYFTINGTTTTNINSIINDSSNNIFIVGTYTSSTTVTIPNLDRTLSSSILPITTVSDTLFIFKYNTLGKLIAYAVFSGGDLTFTSIGIDLFGNIYVSIENNNSFTIPNIDATSSSSGNTVFTGTYGSTIIIKYNSNGSYNTNIYYSKTPTTSISFNAFQMSKTGIIYMVGTYRGSKTFYNLDGTSSSKSLTSSLYGGGFLIKYDLN